MSLAIISPEAPESCKETLRKRGFDVIEVPLCGNVDRRIGFHPDIQIFAAKGHLFVHPDLPASCVSALSLHAEVTVCSKPLGAEYPNDCSYNIAFTGSIALCRKELLPSEISEFFASQKIPVVHVPQGYARCSTVTAGENTVITEDRGVAAAAAASGLAAHIVAPGFVPLKGFPRGFIGGASGTCGGTLFFTGSLSAHPDREAIIEAAGSSGKKVVELSEAVTEDFGSILFV